MQKNCSQCGVVFSYNPPQGYPDKRKYCDVCSAKRKVEWDAKTRQRGEDMQNPTSHQEPPVQVVRPYDNVLKKPAQHTTMYVSYAKDIFVAQIANPNVIISDVKNAQDCMKEAIELVKQAREAFE